MVACTGIEPVYWDLESPALTTELTSQPCLGNITSYNKYMVFHYTHIDMTMRTRIHQVDLLDKSIILDRAKD